LKDSESIYYYYKELNRLRKEHDIIVYGTYDLILDEHEQIYAYTRTLGEEKLVILCNFTGENAAFTLPENLHFESSSLLIGNYENHLVENGKLKPYEAKVYILK
jgi:oligo-1,6-glucosidase